uniref:Uncharacterized protein n=1 Tax=Aquisalinus luteolus TaxID=1566827 RepID=A0A8J3A5Y1_9PROT|nr:hypothetical protein GCM10011355_28310 [Aquisalinus luteolus]
MRKSRIVDPGGVPYLDSMDRRAAYRPGTRSPPWKWAPPIPLDILTDGFPLPRAPSIFPYARGATRRR